MTETRNLPTDHPSATPPQSTNSTLVLIAVLGVLTAVFILAGMTDLQPVMKVFHWLALIF